MKTIKIYYLADPITDEIKYVGKTEKELDFRLHQHLVKKDNTYVRCWIKSLKEKKRVPTIELIEEVSENEWKFWEKYWICQFKCWGFKLTNLTLGGDGCNIRHHSEDTKKKLSETRKKQGSPWMKNRIVTEETKKKLSIFNTGRKIPEEKKINFGKHNNVKIKQYDLNGVYITTFKSIADAGRFIKKHPNNVQMCASGKCRSAGGYIWRYENDEFDKFYTKLNEATKKPVLQYDLIDNFIKEWESASQPQKELGFLSVSIINCCNGKQKTSYEYKWKYKQNVEKKSGRK